MSCVCGWWTSLSFHAHWNLPRAKKVKCTTFLNPWAKVTSKWMQIGLFCTKPWNHKRKTNDCNFVLYTSNCSTIFKLKSQWFTKGLKTVPFFTHGTYCFSTAQARFVRTGISHVRSKWHMIALSSFRAEQSAPWNLKKPRILPPWLVCLFLLEASVTDWLLERVCSWMVKKP